MSNTQTGKGSGSVYSRLATWVEGDGGQEERYVVNAVIETPKGGRNKITFDDALGIFALTKILPAGMVFPFDFGFVSGTLGEDGDPLDVLILMDEPAFTGCLVQTRLIGVIEAEQTERDGTTMRNDRLIGVCAESVMYKDISSIHQLSDTLIEQIEHFFLTYNELAGKVFKPLGRFAAARARELVAEADGRR